MRESPIPMSPMMVRPTLADIKTQTRRILRPQPVGVIDWICSDMNDVWRAGVQAGEVPEAGSWTCPYGEIGDRLWVREAWRVPAGLDHLSGKEIDDKRIAAGYTDPICPIEYVADGWRHEPEWWVLFDDNNEAFKPGRYRHARFMPRWAARTVLEITDTRIERLQSISTPDAIAEGVTTLPAQWINDHFTDHRERMAAASAGERSIPNPPSPRRLFEALWEQLNGIGSFKEDPWVWVVSYKRLENA